MSDLSIALQSTEKSCTFPLKVASPNSTASNFSDMLSKQN